MHLRSNLGPFTLENEAALSVQGTTNYQLWMRGLVYPRSRCEMEILEIVDAATRVKTILVPRSSCRSLQGNPSRVPPKRALRRAT